MDRRRFIQSAAAIGVFGALNGLDSGWLQAAATGSEPAPGTWPFGLTGAQEARAAKLHADSIIWDMVNQEPGGANIFKAYPPELIGPKLEALGVSWEGLGGAIMLPYQLQISGESDLIKQWWDLSGITVGTAGFAIMSAADREAAKGTVDDPKAQFDALPWLSLATTATEIRAAKAEGRIVKYGYCQPVYSITRNLDDIDAAYQQGLRMLMLTYNRMDFVGAGCTERTDAGLSMYGVEVVKRINELGMIVDTAHCGRQTTLDACTFSTGPVFANHSCAQGVYDHARGKSDEELKAIAGTGGIVGVVAVPFFLSPKPDATIDVMLDHIDYISNLIGWQHVGIGTDWPMQCPADILEATLGSMVHEIGFRDQDNISVSQTLLGFSDYRDMPNITRGLVARGYNDEQIKGILGENVLRVFGEVCG